MFLIAVATRHCQNSEFLSFFFFFFIFIKQRMGSVLKYQCCFPPSLCGVQLHQLSLGALYNLADCVKLFL